MFHVDVFFNPVVCLRPSGESISKTYHKFHPLYIQLKVVNTPQALKKTIEACRK